MAASRLDLSQAGAAAAGAAAGGCSTLDLQHKASLGQPARIRARLDDGVKAGYPVGKPKP
jgi:hypothetical protein